MKTAIAREDARSTRRRRRASSTRAATTSSAAAIRRSRSTLSTAVKRWLECRSISDANARRPPRPRREPEPRPWRVERSRFDRTERYGVTRSSYHRGTCAVRSRCCSSPRAELRAFDHARPRADTARDLGGVRIVVAQRRLHLLVSRARRSRASTRAAPSTSSSIFTRGAPPSRSIAPRHHAPWSWTSRSPASARRRTGS